MLGELDGWYKYVRGEDIPEWEDKGWEASDATTACHHNAYSIIMKWTGDGDPPETVSQLGCVHVSGE
jgi:hypothetical protein